MEEQHLKSKKHNVPVVLHVLSLLTWFVLASTAMGQTAREAQELFANVDAVTMTGVLRNPSLPFALEVKCTPLDKIGTLGTSTSYLGTDGEDPWCVVRKIAFSVGGKAVKFPLDSYTDLANVNLSFGVGVRSRPGTVTLHINGGDGAGSYKARFIIQGGRLTTREIKDVDEQGEVRLRKKVY